MSGGDACRWMEDSKGAGFHADVRSLSDALGAPAEPPPSSRRSAAITQPYADPFADTMAAPSSFASDHPDWCVDAGSALHTMTTFELWEALERGQVLAYMRVWREGMECWTPIGEITEFTWAIAGTPPPPPEPETLPEPQAEARTGPRPAPPPAIEAPPESSIRPVGPPAPARLRGARGIGVGSAIAIAAVVSAILMRSGPTPTPPTSPLESPGAAPSSAPSPLWGSAPPVGRGVGLHSSMEATPPLVEVEPAPVAATKHDERGQRRQPRDGRHAYGR